MELTYTVSKEKCGQWYAHRIDNHEVLKGSYGEKRHAMRAAAAAMNISYKEFIRLRKNERDK